MNWNDKHYEDNLSDFNTRGLYNNYYEKITESDYDNIFQLEPQRSNTFSNCIMNENNNNGNFPIESTFDTFTKRIWSPTLFENGCKLCLFNPSFCK